MHESSDILIKHELLVAKVQFHSNGRASGTEQGSFPTRSRTQIQALLTWCPPHLISNGKCMDAFRGTDRSLISPWGVLLGILGGVCRPVLQILPLLQTKKCHFSHPFSDLASKKLCHHYLD